MLQNTSHTKAKCNRRKTKKNKTQQRKLEKSVSSKVDRPKRNCL